MDQGSADATGRALHWYSGYLLSVLAVLGEVLKDEQHRAEQVLPEEALGEVTDNAKINHKYDEEERRGRTEWNNKRAEVP